MAQRGNWRAEAVDQLARLLVDARRIGIAGGEDDEGGLAQQLHALGGGLDRGRVNKMLGRHGISTRSATSAAAWAALSAWGGVSMTITFPRAGSK